MSSCYEDLKFVVEVEMSHTSSRAKGFTSKRSLHATKIPDSVLALSSRGKTRRKDLLIINPDMLLSFRSTVALAGNLENTFLALLPNIEGLELSSFAVDREHVSFFAPS